MFFFLSGCWPSLSFWRGDLSQHGCQVMQCPSENGGTQGCQLLPPHSKSECFALGHEEFPKMSWYTKSTLHGLNIIMDSPLQPNEHLDYQQIALKSIKYMIFSFLSSWNQSKHSWWFSFCPYNYHWIIYVYILFSVHFYAAVFSWSVNKPNIFHQLCFLFTWCPDTHKSSVLTKKEIKG